MAIYNLRIENTRYNNITMPGIIAVILKRGQLIRERYNVDPVKIQIDLVNHRDAVRLAWYDDAGKVFLSINKKEA